LPFAADNAVSIPMLPLVCCLLPTIRFWCFLFAVCCRRCCFDSRRFFYFDASWRSVLQSRLIERTCIILGCCWQERPFLEAFSQLIVAIVIVVVRPKRRKRRREKKVAKWLSVGRSNNTVFYPLRCLVSTKHMKLLRAGWRLTWSPLSVMFA
jgi:hypothetical protein